MTVSFKNGASAFVVAAEVVFLAGGWSFAERLSVPLVCGVLGLLPRRVRKPGSWWRWTLMERLGETMEGWQWWGDRTV